MKQPQTIAEQISDYGKRGVQKLFGLEDDWYQHLDITKNNYALGLRHLEASNFKDAEFRFKLVIWLDPKNKNALYQLARAQVALGKKLEAHRTLKKLLALDPKHVEASELMAALSGKKTALPKIAIGPESDAKILYEVHKESFPIYWKESEISEMLLISGTQAWSAREAKPLGMLMMRSQFEQAEILTIAVVPDARRKHLAQQLLELAHKKLAEQGVKKIFLEVAEDNQSANLLYSKLGYVETARRKGYYKQEDGSLKDALVMSKEIA